jgi:hypothetical protein
MKASNEYSRQFGRLYSRIPKAVFAAVAFSYTSSGGDDLQHAIQCFMQEWQILFDNGIVSQKPPKLINDGVRIYPER